MERHLHFLVHVSLAMVWFQTGFNGLVFLIGVSWFGE
jgi:hypothetical protein